jgi:hypothetical protein
METENKTMPLAITDTTMRSTATPHTARTAQDGGWSVSWLPDHTLTRDQAVSAMTIAETVSSGLEPGDRRWLHLDGWARKLGLTGTQAVVLASEPLTDPEREAGQ